MGTALVTLEYNKEGAYTPHHTVGTIFKLMPQKVSQNVTFRKSVNSLRHILFLCIQPFHSAADSMAPAALVPDLNISASEVKSTWLPASDVAGVFRFLHDAECEPSRAYEATAVKGKPTTEAMALLRSARH